jgi:hypothetical protein
MGSDMRDASTIDASTIVDQISVPQ